MGYKEDFVSENFYPGMDEFLTEPPMALFGMWLRIHPLLKDLTLQRTTLHGRLFHYPPLKAKGVYDLRVGASPSVTIQAGHCPFAVLDGSGFTNTVFAL